MRKFLLLTSLIMLCLTSYAQTQPQGQSGMSDDSTTLNPNLYMINRGSTVTANQYYTQAYTAPPTCGSTPSTNSCISVAGSYGIPATSTSGTANFLQNDCTGALTFTGGCSTPPLPPPPPPPCVNNPTTNACAVVAGTYGIPAASTIGTANFLQNSCTGVLTYQNGCSAPPPPPPPPPPPCVNNPTTNACSSVAGSYGILPGYTSGTANFLQNSCTGVLTYQNGCSAPPPPPPPCVNTPATNACSSVAGSYGILPGYTSGTANFLRNSCTGILTYQNGCSAPPPPCVNNPTTNACSSVAGSYGIPAGFTSGTANFLQNSCSGVLTYQNGCSAPPCVNSPVTNSCAAVAGTYGIPNTYTAGTANFLRNSCSGVLTYQNGCSIPLPPTVAFSIHAGLHPPPRGIAGLWNGYSPLAPPNGCQAAHPCSSTISTVSGHTINQISSSLSGGPCAVTNGCYTFSVQIAGTLPLNTISLITVNGISMAPTSSFNYNTGFPTAYSVWYIDAYSTAYPGHGPVFPVLSYPNNYNIIFN